MEALEQRRFLAADLVVSIVQVEFPFNLPGSDAERFVHVNNVGDTTFTGVVRATVSYSADKTLGNADDVSSAFFNSELLTIEPGKSEILEDEALLPSESALPVGRYYLGARIEVLSGAEASAANNSRLDANVVEIFKGAWPSTTILGTAANDVILMSRSRDGLAVVSVNGETHSTETSGVFIDAGAGDDKISYLDVWGYSTLITGSGGRDTIVCDAGNDSISGGNGRDKIVGGTGNDQILGGAQGDWIFGNEGNDTLSGAGGNDRITDIFGDNYLLGGAGNDVFVCRYTGYGAQHDTVSGGSGFDRAQIDDSGDSTASIEELLA